MHTQLPLSDLLGGLFLIALIFGSICGILFDQPKN